MDDQRPTPCDYCGDPLGTTPYRDVIMIDARKGIPFPPNTDEQDAHLLFCNEAHFHEWALTSRLPFETSADSARTSAEISEDFDNQRRPFGWSIVASAVVALAIVGLVSLLRLIF